MHSGPATENRATERGRRRKRGNGSGEGPVFVDNSGRRSRLLRRVGVLCLGYAVVLGLAFMGIGTSVAPRRTKPALVAVLSLAAMGYGGWYAFWSAGFVMPLMWAKAYFRIDFAWLTCFRDLAAKKRPRLLP